MRIIIQLAMSPQLSANPTPDRDAKSGPIGVFDSGIGGLSILSALRARLPDETLLYVADQAHVPYGSRSLSEIRRLSIHITEFLLEQGAKLIVVACNTASAAALQTMRAHFPDTPFVGMEPAVKPAAISTQTGLVGVLATPATFHGAAYSTLLAQFAQKVTILEDTCPGLVDQIEAGAWESPETQRILEQALRPMLGQGIDRVVLGCTHYPFVIPMIQAIVGPGVEVIDPAPAIARQTERLLTRHDLANPGPPAAPDVVWTTGNPAQMQDTLAGLPPPLGLGGEPRRPVRVKALRWHKGQLTEKT